MDESADEQVEPYEDELETFERNALAADSAAEFRESDEEGDGDEGESGELPDEDQLIELLTKEFGLLGRCPPGRGALERMAALLAGQHIDYGDIGINAAVLGWIAHAELVREL
jgi:hypothetical protein